VARVKTNVDSGIFTPVQHAAVEALEGDQTWVAERNKVYQRRRDQVMAALKSAGISAAEPKASLYVWAALPPQYRARLLPAPAGKHWRVAHAGSGFWRMWEGYFRLSLAAPDDRLNEPCAGWPSSGRRVEVGIGYW